MIKCGSLRNLGIYEEAFCLKYSFLRVMSYDKNDCFIDDDEDKNISKWWDRYTFF